jgi:hypothetical protein
VDGQAEPAGTVAVRACDNSHAGRHRARRRFGNLLIPELDMPSTVTLDPNLTINEIVARFPETIAVFNRFGLDTCCGGGVRVDEAARRDGLDVASVVAALHDAVDRR